MKPEIVAIPTTRLVHDRIVRSDVEGKTFARDIERLSRSIASRGVMTPLVVCPAGAGKYAIIDGNRRFEAGRTIGLAEFPCIVRKDLRPADEDRVTLLGFSTNEMRSDLAPSQEVEALQRVLDGKGITLEEVARATGKSEGQLKEILSRRNLDASIARMVDRGEIARSASTRLAPLAKKEQKEVVETLKALDIPVSAEAILLYRGKADLASERVSRRVRKKLVENIALQADETRALQEEYRKLERELEAALGTVRAILAVPELSAYLEAHHPAILADFRGMRQALEAGE